MAVRIVQLGTPRAAHEGLRIGTVRRPPRGVPKAEFAKRDFYDVWLPNLAPSAGLMGWIHEEPITPARWKTFSQRYHEEMREPDATHLVDTLAALSKQTDFSVGCYCDDESRCHRSLLRGLMHKAGAEIAAD